MLAFSGKKLFLAVVLVISGFMLVACGKDPGLKKASQPKSTTPPQTVTKKPSPVTKSTPVPPPTPEPPPEQLPEEYFLSPDEVPEFVSEKAREHKPENVDLSAIVGKNLTLESYCPEYEPEKYEKFDLGELEGTYRNKGKVAELDTYVQLTHLGYQRYHIVEQTNLKTQHAKVLGETYVFFQKLKSDEEFESYVGIVNTSAAYRENLDRYDVCSFAILKKSKKTPGEWFYSPLGIRANKPQEWKQFAEVIHRDNNEAIGKDDKVYFKEGSFKYLNYFLDAEDMGGMFQHQETQAVLTYLRPYHLVAVGEKKDPLKIANHHFQKGKEFLEKQDYHRALKEYDQIVARVPNQPRGYWARGGAYLLLQEYQKGLQDIETGFSKYQGSEKDTGLKRDALLMRGAAYEKIGETWKAMENYEKASNMEPHDGIANYSYATLGFREKKGSLNSISYHCSRAIYYNPSEFTPTCQNIIDIIKKYSKHQQRVDDFFRQFGGASGPLPRWDVGGVDLGQSLIDNYMRQRAGGIP